MNVKLKQMLLQLSYTVNPTMHTNKVRIFLKKMEKQAPPEN